MNDSNRVLGRLLAEELTEEQLAAVAGAGTPDTACGTGNQADDCEVNPN